MLRDWRDGLGLLDYLLKSWLAVKLVAQAL
jgi:hypothetical protein